jgi:hypothetical protein
LDAQKARFIVQSTAKSSFLAYDKENNQYFLATGSAAALTFQQQELTSSNTSMMKVGTTWTPFERWALRDEPNIDQLGDIVSDIYNLTRPTFALQQRLPVAKDKDKKSNKDKKKKKKQKKEKKNRNNSKNDLFAGLDIDDENDESSNDSSSDEDDVDDDQNQSSYFSNNNNSSRFHFNDDDDDEEEDHDLSDATNLLMTSNNTNNNNNNLSARAQQRNQTKYVARKAIVSKDFFKKVMETSGVHFVGGVSTRSKNDRIARAAREQQQQQQQQHVGNQNIAPPQQQQQNVFLNYGKPQQQQQNRGMMMMMDTSMNNNRDSPHCSQRSQDRIPLSQEEKKKKAEAFRNVNRFQF